MWKGVGEVINVNYFFSPNNVIQNKHIWCHQLKKTCFGCHSPVNHLIEYLTVNNLWRLGTNLMMLNVNMNVLITSEHLMMVCVNREYVLHMLWEEGVRETLIFSYISIFPPKPKRKFVTFSAAKIVSQPLLAINNVWPLLPCVPQTFSSLKSSLVHAHSSLASYFHVSNAFF